MKTLYIIKKVVLAGIFGLCIVGTGNADIVKFVRNNGSKSAFLENTKHQAIIAFKGTCFYENKGKVGDMYLYIVCTDGTVPSLEKEEFEKKDIEELQKKHPFLGFCHESKITKLIFGEKKQQSKTNEETPPSEKKNFRKQKLEAIEISKLFFGENK
jgi:hypothetical protein